jgi:thiamine pyrophosphate-dependent acetolactate synthase large subunit-like protein
MPGLRSGNREPIKQIIQIHTFPAEVDDHYTLAAGIEGNIVLTLDELSIIACPVDYNENIRLTDKPGKLTEPI